jgi:predicted Fe-Mo cluster-binding NifX family protein
VIDCGYECESGGYFMKIAFITDDGETISQHFGRAHYYLVLELANGVILSREMRDKLGHTHFHQEGRDPNHGLGSGMDAAAHRKHRQMSEVISDCDVIICGGMGRGAYQSMQSFGIQPIVTDVENIDEALQLYREGRLEDQTEKLH